MVFLILESHRALHFGSGVDECAQRVAWQRVVVAARVDIFEISALVIVSFGVGPLEQESFDLVGGVERVTFLLV